MWSVLEKDSMRVSTVSMDNFVIVFIACHLSSRSAFVAHQMLAVLAL